MTRMSHAQSRPRLSAGRRAKALDAGCEQHLSVALARAFLGDVHLTKTTFLTFKMMIRQSVEWTDGELATVLVDLLATLPAVICTTYSR